MATPRQQLLVDRFISLTINHAASVKHLVAEMKMFFAFWLNELLDGDINHTRS